MSRLGRIAFTCTMLSALAGCVDDQPSPAEAEKFDVVIAICSDRLRSTQDFCNRLSESAGDSIVANVLFGRAGGHEVSVRVDTVQGGTAQDDSGPVHVPSDRSLLHAVYIRRAVVCEQTNCALIVHAYVDGIEAANEKFRFIGD